jgi:hypothetical protein
MEATAKVPAPKLLAVNLNLAETLACEPKRKSAVELLGKSAVCLVQKTSIPDELQEAHVGVVAPDTRQRFEVEVVAMLVHQLLLFHRLPHCYR